MDWIRILENNLVLLVGLVLMFSGLGKRVLDKLLRTKKAEAGAVKLEFDNSEEAVSATLKTIWNRFDSLKGDMKELKEGVLGMRATIDSTSKKQDDMYADQLKMMFYTRGLNDEERLAAGLRYASEGYNHQAKTDIIKFGIQHEDMYRGITAGGRHLAISEIDEAIAKRRRDE